MSNYGMSPLLLQRLQRKGGALLGDVSQDEPPNNQRMLLFDAPPQDLDGRANFQRITAPPQYGGDSSLPPRVVQGGDSSLPNDNRRITLPPSSPESFRRSPTAPVINGSSAGWASAPPDEIPLDLPYGSQRITAPPAGGFLENYRRASAGEIPFEPYPVGGSQRRMDEIPLDLAPVGDSSSRLMRVTMPTSRSAGDVDPQENFARITAPSSGGFLDLMRRAPINSQSGEDTARRAPVSPDADSDAIAAQRAAYAPGPAQDRARRMLAEGATKHHASGGWKGVGEHIVDGLKLAGKSLLVSGGNPLAGAMGLVAGTIDPQMEHNFTYNMQLPHVIGQANAEAGIQDENLKRARQYEQGMGEDFYTGQRTLQGQHFDDLSNKYIAGIDATNRRLDQSDEKNAQGWEKINQTNRRMDETEKDQRIGHILSAARIPGRGLTPEARDALKKEGIELPADFNPMTNDIIKTDKGYQIVSFPKTGGAPRISPPIAQPPAPRPRAPRAMTQPQAYAETEKQMRTEGKIASDGTMENPKWRDWAENRKQRLGMTEEDVQQSPGKIPRRIPFAQHPGFKSRVMNTRAQSANQSNQPNKAPAQSNQQQMAAHEAEYQKYYSKATPEERKAMEDAFQRDYGRLPKKP